MGTISSCLKKIGLDEHETAIIQGLATKGVEGGDESHVAAVRAVHDYIKSLEEKRNVIAIKIAESGITPTDAPYKLSDLSELTKVLM